MDSHTPPHPVPEGFVPATHGGPYAVEVGPFWSRRTESHVSLGVRVEKRHCNSAGAAHGGFIASLADLGLIHAVSLAQIASGRPRTHLATATLSVDYTGRAPEGCWLEMVSEVTKLGRGLGFVEGALLADGQRVGRASAIMAVLGPRTA